MQREQKRIEEGRAGERIEMSNEKISEKNKGEDMKEGRKEECKIKRRE